MRTIINIDVPDLHSAATFYQAALGLTLSRVLDHDVAELVGGSSVIYLVQKKAGSTFSSSSSSHRQYGRHWTPVHIDFEVSDIQEAAARALLAGAKQESKCIEWKESKCITFSDPFGHGFCLIEFENATYAGK